MRKKVITSAVIILILSIILLLINHYKGHNSIAAPEITLVYAENQVEDYPTTKGAYEFARLVNERTNGRIKIVVKCNGELGDEKSVIEFRCTGNAGCIEWKRGNAVRRCSPGK